MDNTARAQRTEGYPRSTGLPDRELLTLLDLAVRASSRSEFRGLATGLLAEIVAFTRASFVGPVRNELASFARITLGSDGWSLHVRLESAGCPISVLLLERAQHSMQPFGRREIDVVRYLYSALALGESVFGVAPRSQTFDVVPGESFCRLSPREREVLGFLLCGFDNREIAVAIGSSVNTVRNQLAAIYRKTGAGSRTELVRRALESGLGGEPIGLSNGSCERQVP